ncbi:Cyanovirin-N [Xylariaceae sp. FL1651]|nr:Cyanovirin-N [Xylariaceae sp. FL1651]
MQFWASIKPSLITLLPVANAGWREECSVGGNAQFHIIAGKPYLSTICPSSAGPVCTMLDLSYCYMNSHGHLASTINGHFEKSCKGCQLTGANATILSCSCEMFGKDAPWQDAEIDLEDLVENQNGLLTCWNGGQKKCPGQV